MRLIVALLVWFVPMVLTLPEAAAFDRKPSTRPKLQRKGDAGAKPPMGRTRGEPGVRPQRNALDRWRKMSPQQRQRYMRQLPPERRREFQQRMDRLQNLTPRQRNRLQRNYQQFSEMSPRQQNEFRGMYQRFNKMPADRRPMLMNEYRKLRRMTPEERTKRLQSDGFGTRFRPGEKKLLEDLAKTIPGVD